MTLTHWMEKKQLVRRVMRDVRSIAADEDLRRALYRTTELGERGA